MFPAAKPAEDCDCIICTEKKKLSGGPDKCADRDPSPPLIELHKRSSGAGEGCDCDDCTSKKRAKNKRKKAKKCAAPPNVFRCEDEGKKDNKQEKNCGIDKSMSKMKAELSQLEEQCRAKDVIINLMTEEFKTRVSEDYVYNLVNKDGDETSVDMSNFEVLDVRRCALDSLIIKWAPPKSEKIEGYEVHIDNTLKQKLSKQRTMVMLNNINLTQDVEISVFAIIDKTPWDPPAMALYKVCK